MLQDGYGHRFTITDSAGVETDYDVIYKAPAIQHPSGNAQAYGQSKVTAGARPFDFASNRVFWATLGDMQTPDDRTIPGSPVLATGDIFVDSGLLGFYDRIALDLNGQPTGGFQPLSRFMFNLHDGGDMMALTGYWMPR